MTQPSTRINKDAMTQKLCNHNSRKTTHQPHHGEPRLQGGGLLEIRSRNSWRDSCFSHRNMVLYDEVKMQEVGKTIVK